MTKVLPFVGGVAVVRVGVELVPGVDPSESTTPLPGLPWMILGFLLSIYIPPEVYKRVLKCVHALQVSNMFLTMRLYCPAVHLVPYLYPLPTPHSPLYCQLMC